MSLLRRMRPAFNATVIQSCACRRFPILAPRIQRAFASTSPNPQHPPTLPEKSAFHEKDTRIINPAVPGKLFLVNINAGAQAVDSITNRILSNIVTILAAVGVALYWSVGMPFSFWSAWLVWFLAWMGWLHVGHATWFFGAAALFCAIKLIASA
eukprot:NODE_7561_length_560_cov_6.409002_g6534_i0.p2 GENE.NODE_7561_length_560_cov_6.409002_g6534_i0~~NODE_7561_length_560_cov_6.409002_g6534_i0.p2  ORF type:complete len:154 (-),score=27.16 NODE_7561_length_560_cov_6.409002_g6534_i0:22-483(-)